MPLNLSFTEEKNGYCKHQVDAYLERIFGEYENMNREYKALEEKYRQLELLAKVLEHDKKAAAGLASNFRIKVSQLESEISRQKEGMQDQLPDYTREVARVLMDAEELAQKILARAREEETRQNDAAREENGRLLAVRDQLTRELERHWERLRYGKNI
ncbi:MAG: DivIVA domain-containing protein [Oscillospiraceae bacterium]|nr:DivIVA domain-containing protein [Oscillospiraceae bacterium]